MVVQKSNIGYITKKLNTLLDVTQVIYDLWKERKGSYVIVL
jgi:hypothetical protein